MRHKITESAGTKAKGILEFLIRDRNGRELSRFTEPNLVKIFSKEILSHRMPYSQIWNPDANGGDGAWESSGIDILEEFAPKYILLGASFDDDGVPLETDDDRFYSTDPVTGTPVPVSLEPSAAYSGGLINPITLIEPTRPLKRIETVDFEPTYQPSGTPLLENDVRAINNVVVLETTLRVDEYNGFGVTGSDFFTLTEVALAGGKVFDSIGQCGCTPRELFLEGITESDGSTRPLLCSANGSDTISIDPSESDVDLIVEGDQIRIGGSTDSIDNGSSNLSDLDQTQPYYLVLSKSSGGRDIQLDRAVVDSDGNSVTGQVGIFRDTLRVFSHRILSTPIRKTSDIELVIRWRIIFN